MLIDTHAHVNFVNAYKDDAEEVIRRALRSGISMILVGVNYKTSKRALELANKYESGVYVAVGLHPNDLIEHHEKINGSGYPMKIDGEQIPIQSKMMTITDIYDALTAHDRPYKKAVPHEKALDIIGCEAKGNLVDADLFDMFVEGKEYELVNEKR